MHIFGLFGVVSIGLGTLFGSYLVLIKFFLQQDIADRPLLLLAALLVILGVQFISIGLIGELVTRTYYETQRKPIYVVREEINHNPPTREPLATSRS
jgi:dolichol-phosphate mannosyltransferase